jgi:hypothetical protein
MPWDSSTWTWSRSSKSSNESKAQHAAPAPDPSPYVVPHPIGRSAPYVAANFDYADNPEPTNSNYAAAIGGRKRWKNKKLEQGGETFVEAPGTYPPAGYDPDDWHGYTMEDYWSSQRNEHLINGDEGNPPFGYHRFHSALNPYWYRIPDSRIVRTPHEWDFRRPFDQQNKLGARRLSGEHYSAANIGLTANPSESLKGLTSQKRRRTTYRVEPIEWGEDRPMSGSGVGPGMQYPANSQFGGSYAL